ncbi:cupin domain-containing protein [Pseudomonas aeruginosa]|uniref:cupin domain-containing protein n=1 Tax=Pseudomonas aeruginosa TaxID=287 RepID=UPI001069B641|nr:cupin domain-containing protein [Pseudomonas aeruginosa]
MTALLRAVRPDDGNRYDWGGVCLGWRLLELQHMQVRQEWMPAGGAEAPHWHVRAHQFFYVLSGHLRLSTPDQDVLLESGQGVHVPAGIRHIAANGGDGDVQFLVFSSPSTQGDRIESTSAAEPDRHRDEEPAS